MIRTLVLALALALAALLPASAAAESLREALIGNWAQIEQSQRLSDAEAAAQADTTCATVQLDAGRGIVIGHRDGQFAIAVWENGVVRDGWLFDPEVRGARTEDGRIAIQLSFRGTLTHELTFWRITIDGTERSLLEYLGPTIQSAFYMKCR